MAFENRDTPVKEQKESKSEEAKAGEGSSGKGFDKEQLEKLMEESGMKGKFKMYGREDMDKMMKDHKGANGDKAKKDDAEEL